MHHNIGVPEAVAQLGNHKKKTKVCPLPAANKLYSGDKFNWGLSVNILPAARTRMLSFGLLYT